MRRTRDRFNIQPTLVFPSGQASVGDHAHVQALLQPHPVQHPHNLDDQRVLPQAVSCLGEHSSSRVTGA